MNLTKNSQSINELIPRLQFLERDLESSAEDLLDNFNKERKSLLQKAQAELNAIPGNEGKRFWCGLSLHVRVVDASIQITWFTLHINSRTKRKQFIALPKGAANGYDLRRLKPHANDFEWELVKETERQAAKIRTAWKRFVEARNQLRYLYQGLDDE